jgi:hypothetical protein
MIAETRSISLFEELAYILRIVHLDDVFHRL